MHFRGALFIFPGNAGHHSPQHTLYTNKSGGGIGVLAGLLGKAGYPVLSLPTTDMEQWKPHHAAETPSTQQTTVDNAIMDLYRAVGAGRHLMLPIREHPFTNKGQRYFNAPLQRTAFGPNMEPSFWGLNALKPHQFGLNDYYIEQLNALSNFIDMSKQEKELFIKSNPKNPFLMAYSHGTNMHPTDPWLKRVVNFLTSQRSVAPDASPKLEKSIEKEKTHPHSVSRSKNAFFHRNRPQKKQKGPIHRFPANYARIYEEHANALQGAQALLNDYTKNNSMLNRILSLHWNRHYTQQVNAIALRIGPQEGGINTMQALIDELRRIQVLNPNGSLARRIAFIEEKKAENPIPKENRTARYLRIN